LRRVSQQLTFVEIVRHSANSVNYSQSRLDEEKLPLLTWQVKHNKFGKHWSWTCTWQTAGC